MKESKISYYLLALIFLLLGGCHNSNEPDELASDTVIIFGESIARVNIGDDSSTVVKKLGKPTAILDGDFKGYIFYYTEGEFAKTFVSVSQDKALGLGVIVVSVEGPHKGKSIEGIGINSKRDDVLSKLGTPSNTQGDSVTVYDSYYYEKNSFGITYTNQHILRISMGMPRLK